MDPISLLIAGGSLALTAYSAFGSKKAAGDMAGAQTAMVGTEMQQDKLRRQAMEVNAQRQQMEVLRNAQRTRSVGIAAQTNQGAQFGSVSGGASGAVSGSANTNLAGIDSSLSFGEQMFDLNAQLSQQKIAYAKAGGDLATAQGYGHLGSSLMSAYQPLSNLGHSAANTGGQAFDFFSKPGLIGMPE